MSRWRGFAAAMLVLAVAVGAPVSAPGEWLPVANHESAESDARGGVSLGEAVARVQRATGETVIAAETRTRGGQTIHHVRVLSREGRVRVYRVDARSGRIMR